MLKRFDWTPWFLISPVLFLFAVFYAMPVLVMLGSSVERLDTGTFKIVDTLTVFNYWRFLSDSYYVGTLFLTLKISVMATLVSLVFSYPVALYLGMAGQRERSILLLLIISPLLVSVVIRSFGWLIIFGPKGVINVILLKLGILSAPLTLLHTQTAVVIGLSHVFYPFMVLSIYSAMQNIDSTVVRAARNLGAAPVTIFRRIIFPLSAPGVISGSIIVFGLSMSSFVTPAILGGPFVKVLAYLGWEQEVVVLDWPFAAAISVIILIVTCAVMATYNRLVERQWFEGAFR